MDAPVALVCASAETVPLAAEAFDLVMCDHGAMSFCDPEIAVSEAARLLRIGGRLVFSHTTPWPYLAWNFAKERVGRRLRRSYFGMRRFDDGAGEGTVDFQLPYGEWIRLFRANGFVVEDLIEPRPAPGASSSYRKPEELDWALERLDDMLAHLL